MERFEFTFSTLTTEPPTGSQVRLDNADPAAATKVWVRDTTAPGEDVHTLLMLLPEGSRLWLADYDDHTRYMGFVTTGPAVAKAGYVELPVAWVTSGAALVAQRMVLDAAVPADSTPPSPAPGPSVPPLATLDDLRALGVTGDADDLNRLLDAASAAARAWCGWVIAPGQTAVDLPGRYAGKVTTLPSLWVSALHSVTVDGTLLDPVPAYLASGVLQYATGPFSRCVANVDHGFDPIPADVSMAVAGLVARVVSAPAGVTGERVGMWSVSYMRGALAVDESAAGGLAPYRLPSVP